MISTKQLAWAAGFLEGEGCFTESRTCPAVTVAQVQREPLDRLHAMFGGTVREIKRKVKTATQQDYFRWDLYGNRAIGVMMTVLVMMSPRRTARIIEVIEHWKARPKQGAHYRNMTHCKAGHEYLPGSWTRKGENGRQCKACMKTYHAAEAARKEN